MEKCNLNILDKWKNIFSDMPIGFSDHTKSIYTPAFAVAKGASVIEKHFTLNNNLKYNEIPEWDSIGHMSLIGALEDEFGISIDTDDIIDFSSYAKGIETLAKYGVLIE